MNFIFAKLFEQYRKTKNESPVFSITLYVSFVYLILLFAFLLPLGGVLKVVYLEGEVIFNEAIVLILIFSVFSVINFLVYYKFIKKKLIYKLVDKYKMIKVSNFPLYLAVVFMPVFFLILGATVAVILKGGKILNWQFDGIIH